MFIKMFREHEVRVQDPLRPGRRTFETRLRPSGAESHGGVDGVEYFADADGWIEVPAEVGTEAVKYRFPDGARFYTPEQVDEEAAAGRINPDLADEALVLPQRGPVRVDPPRGKDSTVRPPRGKEAVKV